MKLDVVCTNCGTALKRYETKTGMYFCNTNCKAEWQRKQKPVDKEWLYQKYVVEKLTATDIAKIVKRNSKRVWEWLRDYGIETRSRGAESQYFITGKLSDNFKFNNHKQTEEMKQKQRERRLKDGHVPYLKDGIHWLHHPGAISPSWKGGVTPERQAIYSGLAWKESVKTVWKKADAKCERCGKDHRLIDRNKEKFAIHHLHPFATYKHLRRNPDNLILLCRECHLFVHSKKNVNKEFMLKEGFLPEWIQSKK